MHADGVLVDLFGIDLPGELVGGDVDADGFGDLVDRDLGVIACADVDPAVAAPDRPAGRTDEHLDAIGCVDEFELVEVAGRTERRPLAVLAFDLDGIATAGTELA